MNLTDQEILALKHLAAQAGKPPEPELLNKDQAARFLNIPTRMLMDNYNKKWKIQVARLSKKNILFPRQSLIDFIERQIEKDNPHDQPHRKLTSTVLPVDHR